ncbi:uncharacterized protein LOC141912995 [Tubulanus polymorphus]|uniref:uncharacterized protein LOC141912995 n=1 Tax=Tubulanus polymorphus TaxID=672921 RepID=UPI003DA67A43
MATRKKADTSNKQQLSDINQNENVPATNKDESDGQTAADVAAPVVTSAAERLQVPAAATAASDDDATTACSPIATESTTVVATWICVGCEAPINDKYFLKAMHQFWHEDCLKCSCCNSRLGDIGASLYTRSNLILCKRDYFRLFGCSGQCAACENSIPAYEMVMKVKQHVYHLDCFSCFMCLKRFCIGDRFYLNDTKIMCEHDYVQQFFMSPQFRSPIVPPPSEQRKRTPHIFQRQTTTNVNYFQGNYAGPMCNNH